MSSQIAIGIAAILVVSLSLGIFGKHLHKKYGVDIFAKEAFSCVAVADVLFVAGIWTISPEHSWNILGYVILVGVLALLSVVVIANMSRTSALVGMAISILQLPFLAVAVWPWLLLQLLTWLGSQPLPSTEDRKRRDDWYYNRRNKNGYFGKRRG